MEEKKVTGKLPYEKAEMEIIEIQDEKFIVASGYWEGYGCESSCDCAGDCRDMCD